MGHVVPPSAREVFTCDTCSKFFDTRGKYNQHRKTHSKPFQCDRCPRSSFALRSDLKRHVDAIHRIGKEQYPCTAAGCEFRATRQDNVAQHLEKVHHLKRSKKGRKKMSRAKSNDVRMQRPSHYHLLQAAEVGNLAYIGILLDGGIDPSGKAEDGSTALHCAAKAGQIEVATMLLQHNVDVEARNTQGLTPLFEAVTGDNQQMVQMLLNLGAEPRISDKSGNSILQYMATHDMIAMLDLFLEFLGTDCLNEDQTLPAGPLLHIAARSKTSVHCLQHLLQYQEIDANIKDAKHRTALHCAVECGNEDGAQALLSHRGIDINAKTRSEGWTPLHVAAKTGHERITRLLLGCRSVDMNVRDRFDRTPLQLAAKYASSILVELLLEQNNIDTGAQRYRTPTPFYLALRLDDTALVMLFLERDDVKDWHKDDMERTVIRGTAQFACTKLLKSLLDQRIINPEGIDKSSASPLHHAARYGNLEALELLLRYKSIQINGVNRYGETPLYKAAKFGHAEIAERLLQLRGIHIDTITGEGQTLLHAAAKGGLVGVTRLVRLLGKDTDLNHLDKQGRTALHVGIDRRRVEVVKMLLGEEGVALDTIKKNGQTLLHAAAAWAGTPEIFQMLLDRSVLGGRKIIHLNHPDNEGRTALHVAIDENFVGAVGLLLEAEDITLNTIVDEGETFLHTAAWAGSPEIVQALLNQKVIDVNARAYDIWDDSISFVTALDLAKKSWRIFGREADRAAIIELLKTHGATEQSTTQEIQDAPENSSGEEEGWDSDVDMETDPSMGYEEGLDSDGSD